MTWFKWRIADLIDWFYGDKVCWPRLAMWAMGSLSGDLPQAFNGTRQCQKERANFDGECYCGKMGGYMPNLSPEFWIRGK